jgi:hypothetical protein
LIKNNLAEEFYSNKKISTEAGASGFSFGGNCAHCLLLREPDEAGGDSGRRT